MKAILGKKLEMTQKFAADGAVVPVTKVLAGPCTITQVKTVEKDGYSAVQVGFGVREKQNKPMAGHLKDLGNLADLIEFRPEKPEEMGELKRGDKITADIFAVGDMVDVSGYSKGRGFAGVVKRHHFHGQNSTHGHKDQARMPGSIGAGGNQHVFKGLRMGGHMGDAAVTVKNLEIVEVDPKNNFLYIKGAVPGARNGLLEIRAIKK